MTTAENFTAQIEAKTNRKKYGKMEFEKPKEKALVVEIDLKNDEKFQSAKESAKALFAEIDLEASSEKRLQKLIKCVDEIIDELIPTLKKLSDLRREMKQ